MNYEDIKKLHELLESGAITQEEFDEQKKKLLGSPDYSNFYWGMEERRFSMFMHLSQLLNFCLPFISLLVPIVMWISYKDQNEFINANGKAMINWMISKFLYWCIAVPLCFILVGIPLVIALVIMDLVFCIVAGIKASEGTVWKYPTSIEFFK